MRRGNTARGVPMLMQTLSREHGSSFAFPHPYQSLNLESGCRRERPGQPTPLWVQLRHRRAAILSVAHRALQLLLAARRSMGDPEQKAAIRHIAAEAGVSSPTVYNLVGGRREIL